MVDAAAAIRGQPSQYGPEQQDKHNGDPEAWGGDSKDGKQLARSIEYGIAFDRG